MWAVLSGIACALPSLISAFIPALSGASTFYWMSLFLAFVSCRSFKKNSLCWVLIIVGFVIAPSSLLNVDAAEYARYKAIMLIFKFTPLLLIPLFLRGREIAWFAGYAAGHLMIVLQLVVSSIFSLQDIGISSRLEIGELNPIWLSRIMAEFLLLVSFLFRAPASVMLAFVLFSLIPFYVLGSKGPLVSAVLAYFYGKLTLGFSVKFFIFLLTVLILLSGLYLFVASNIPEDAYIVQRFLRQVPDGSSYQDQSRAVVWPVVVSKLQDADVLQLLFGHGVGSYPTFYYGPEFVDRAYPHNIILELLVEYGLIFAIVVLSLTVVIFIRGSYPYTVLFLFFFLNAQFSGDLILNEKIVLYGAFSMNLLALPLSEMLRARRKS